MSGKNVHFLVVIVILLALSACEIKQDEKKPVGNLQENGVITFVSEGATFSPIITVNGSPDITWTWADGTTSSGTTPSKNYGSAASRSNTLSVKPWSALKKINLGYKGYDGGSQWDNDKALTTATPDSQFVSSVTGLEIVAPYLDEWFSCTDTAPLTDKTYNYITTLDFSNFVKLTRIECYGMKTLVNINLTNTPLLGRLCVEDCGLMDLDLSQCPALEDLRGAVNNFPDINFGNIGSSVWHICIRNNYQFTDRTMFANSNQFPSIAELFLWGNNQTGVLDVPSTSTTRNVDIEAFENTYTSLDLSGSLQNLNRTGIVNMQNNRLESVNISGCVQINNLNLSFNNLDQSDVDGILLTLDGLGRSNVNTSAVLICDLRGNSPYSATGRLNALNLENKGWTVYTSVNTGSATINFSTSGETTSMYCTYSGTAELIWHWSDGTTTTATSGQTVTKNGLGAGTHSHYMTIDKGAALSQFGAPGGGGQGSLIAISGLEACGYLTVLYVYNEIGLTSIGRTNTTRINEYHLAGTAISATEMDNVFADAVATMVTGGRFYAPNNGTAASDADRQTLLNNRGWTISF